MATISFHASDAATRATFTEHAIQLGGFDLAAGRAFGVLKIITQSNVLDFYVAPDRFEWAAGVAAAINAPVAQAEQADAA